MDQLEPHQIIIGKPEKLLDVDWRDEWKERENL
jgi:hypothetical protein